MTEKKNNIRRAHDPFFRWLFANVKRLRLLLGLAGKVDRDVGEFLSSVNLDTLERIPDSYSEVDESSTTGAKTGTRSRILKKGILNFSMVVCFRLRVRL